MQTTTFSTRYNEVPITLFIMGQKMTKFLSSGQNLLLVRINIMYVEQFWSHEHFNKRNFSQDVILSE
jgi:hypothetical protein